MLCWIGHLMEKRWMTPTETHDFLHALDDLLNIEMVAHSKHKKINYED
jgi:hypothetical protein